MACADGSVVPDGPQAGYGSFRFGQGQLSQRVTALERASTYSTEERGQFVTRNEPELIRDDLRGLGDDIREVRETQRQILFRLSK